MMVNKHTLKSSNPVLKVLRTLLRFSLLIFAAMLEGSLKASRKKHEPTLTEIMYGERIIGSDEYVFPNQKFHE